VEHNPFGHVDLRVKDLKEARVFFSELLPALGFPRVFHNKKWLVFAAEGDFPHNPAVVFTEDPQHISNSNRIAFWASSQEEVDRLSAMINRSTATDIEGPLACPEYSASYYATFFDDPSGNHFEIYYRDD